MNHKGRFLTVWPSVIGCGNKLLRKVNRLAWVEAIQMATISECRYRWLSVWDLNLLRDHLVAAMDHAGHTITTWPRELRPPIRKQDSCATPRMHRSANADAPT